MIDGLINAGEILVGQHTPFSAANFVIGCPASLPTSGFAHVSSGITADTFLKRTAIAEADAGALSRMTPSILALADHEGFPAHGDAVRLRQHPFGDGSVGPSDEIPTKLQRKPGRGPHQREFRSSSAPSRPMTT